MSYIYQPRGKAFEYCELALNIYNGCSHGCRYCYVPAIRYQTREKFQASPQTRVLNERALTKDLEANRGRSVLMCFTCDPYQPIDVDLKVTRQIIEKFSQTGISPIILTKGGKRSMRDLDLLARIPGAKYGATLTFINPEDSILWEPGAALPQERMDALKQAHELGIHTWASLEPVIDSAQSLQLIRETKDFVDEYKVGRWNHDRAAEKIDWRSFLQEAISELKRIGKPYYIKRDLAKYA